MQKYYCRRLSIVAVWCLVLCVQLSYEQSPQQLRWPTIPPNILTNQNLSCCQIDQTWLDFFNQKNSTYTLTSRRQNITCFGGRVLFPYGPECADLELSKDMTRSHPIDLGYHLKFMGHRFNKAWVNQHGFISFQESFLGQTLSHEDWPHPMYPYVDDPVFIAPLYAQTDLAGDKLEDVIETKYGRVLYKVIVRKDLPLYYTEEEKFVYQLTMKILDDTQRDIRESVPGGEEFEAKYALLATWKSVAFLGNSLTDITLRPRNTFQAMIISDNYHSYAVFNYEHIEWYAATSQGGNPETGTGGKAAKIGFNRGNGTLWHGHRPFSENAQLMQSLSNFSNVGVPGRFIFRIDEWIQPAGCADIDFDDKRELYIWPRNGNMLGGQEVNITGPCFHENTFFLCKWGDGFDAPITIGETTFLYHNHSEIRSRCVQPTIYFNGRVNLSISLDQGVTFEWKTEYNIVDPLRYPAKVELVNVREWHDSSTPARLVVRWNRFDLSFAESDLVDVELWGYYEDDDGPHWDFLQVIGKKKLNKGSFGFDVAPNRAPNETMARRYKLGAIGISMFDSQYADHDPHFTMSKRIYSALHPLGWWRNDEMKFYYDKHSFLFGNSRGENWAEDQCRWWHEYRRFEDRNWLDELEVCPPTVFFAIGDAGVWAPDPSCNMYGSEYNELNCLQHPEATHCVVTLRRSESGAGNRCCYDKNGNLMYTNDTKSGSTPDRYHSLGIPPYNEYGKVPGLSHYFHDIVPFYLCCHWSNLCDSYLYLRQTKDARGYKEPRMAVTYGDPHFITFDGKDYTFNGKGEFTLFRSKKYNFRLQARFEQPPNATFCLYSSKGQINATRITAISAMQDDSDMVEVRQRVSPSQTYNFKCDIVINGKIYYFNFTEEKTQIFKNVFVISPLNDEFQSNITIMFNTSGIGVNVECMEGLMHVRASAPASLFKDTNGLFGYWDNITGNDFTSPDGSSNQLTLKPDLLYQRFGMAWRVRDESESIFHYSGSWSYDTFHDQRPFIREWQRFRPWFTATEIPFPSNVTFTKEEMIEMCEGDEQCLYDTAALGSLEVGKQTRDAHRYYRLVHENMKSVNSCGIYLLKGGIRTLSKGNYLAGSVMRISCDKGYTLFGYPEFFCNWNGTWLPTNGQWIDRFRNWPYCEHYHITAIRWTSVGISIAWTVLLAAAFIYAIFVKKQRDYRLDDPEYPDDDGNVDIDIDKPQDEPYVEEETKHLEQNYYKDGFVPAMKALSNLTKSMHSLNTLVDQPEKKSPEPEENPDQSIEDVVNTSDLAKAEKFEKPSIILQIPIKNPQLANVANQSGSRVQTPSPKTINPNQNRPLDNSTPIYPYPNRNSQQQTPPQQQQQPYVNQFNFDETDRPYYGNQQSQQSQRSQQQQPPPILSQPPPQSSSSDSSFMENRGTPAATVTADDALDNQQSVESLKQKQATNPYLKRMQQIREQQQRQVEAQLKNQSNNSSFNQNNVVIDSDV